MKKFFIFCALIAASFAVVSCCPIGDANNQTEKKGGCCHGHNDFLQEDTLLGQGFVSYITSETRDGHKLLARYYDGYPVMASYEFYYGGHKYISFRHPNSSYKGTVHAPDCWCRETHRDTVVIVHNNTEYLTISKREIDSIVKKSIEKNMENYFQKLKEINYEKVISSDLGAERCHLH